MSRADEERECPACGAVVSARDTRCPECRKALPDEEDERTERAVTAKPERRVPRRERDDEDDDWDDEDDDDRPRRSVRRDQDDPTTLIVPTNVSGWAIASCYMGLIGFCIPLFGLVFAVPALICGIIALRKPARGGTYGAVTSNIRAVIGVVLSSLAILLYGGFLIVGLLGGFK